MKAITIPVPGDADALVLDDVPAPEPGPTEVLVDGRRRRRQPRRPDAAPGLLRPAAGRVAVPRAGGAAARSPRSASEVEGWSVGDEVCALLSGGGYAEQVAVPAGQLLPVPAGVSLRDAAALPEVVCTVWSNVFLTASLQPGQTLLVHGGSSGIGTMAIQLAREVGAHVAVTAGSAAKLEACRELGAEILINYREQDFVEVLREHTDGAGADVILDNMGAKYLARNVEALATGGRLVVIGMQGGTRAELDLGALHAQAGGRHRHLAARPPRGREGDHRGGRARARLAADRVRAGAPDRPRHLPAGGSRRRPPRAGGQHAHRQGAAHAVRAASPGGAPRGLVTCGCSHLPMFGLLADRRPRPRS